MQIDAHQHYWNPERGDYGWLTPELAPLYRTFGPDDLAPLRERAGVARTVVVQAAPTVDETRYLLELASNEPSIAGVVGWVPMLDPDAPALIAELAQKRKFKGVRPMLQDLPDDNWIANPALKPAVDALIASDLAFDALIFTRHVDALETFIARFPQLRVVIDHGAKPPIRNGDAGWHAWAEGITRLAKLPHVHCKLSGLATEAAQGWTEATLRPYVDHLLAAFGPKRLMWGSDWPVLNLNGDYLLWHSIATLLLSSLSDAERDAVFGGNAAAFYRL
ncbi:amidohydrolase family protein [Paraburkholderia phymatum]|uniref:Amidohydrolase 2 n=1 Tax=Paraburkholderia phymatum (strain DSM 17167 / CIP 108236 / LMG 21445 / STM815) TaxID=391038 RepID=B2JQ72_PARP8|nr:amidohydrolase family protein [Paraburkholderia phymatum]ACC73413.1 amidohydrolase 2 [Paraburkholderia phymatum STM815]